MTPKQDAKTFEFVVDNTSDLPLWIQLRNRIAYLITSGYYEPAEHLPTVRQLASALSVNYNTVNKAYLALKSDGFIESTPGRGAFVRDLEVEIDEELSTRVDHVLGECITSCTELGLDYHDIQKCFQAKLHEVMVAHGVENPDEADGPAEGKVVAVHIHSTTSSRKAGAQ